MRNPGLPYGAESRADLVERSQAGDEQGGLTVDGRVQFFLGTFKAELRKVVPEQRARPVVQRAGGPQGVGQLLTHANGLRTLAGKEKSSLAQDFSVSTTSRPM